MTRSKKKPEERKGRVVMTRKAKEVDAEPVVATRASKRTRSRAAMETAAPETLPIQPTEVDGDDDDDDGEEVEESVAGGDDEGDDEGMNSENPRVSKRPKRAVAGEVSAVGENLNGGEGAVSAEEMVGGERRSAEGVAAEKDGAERHVLIGAKEAVSVEEMAGGGADASVAADKSETTVKGEDSLKPDADSSAAAAAAAAALSSLPVANAASAEPDYDAYLGGAPTSGAYMQHHDRYGRPLAAGDAGNPPATQAPSQAPSQAPPQAPPYSSKDPRFPSQSAEARPFAAPQSAPQPGAPYPAPYPEYGYDRYGRPYPGYNAAYDLPPQQQYQYNARVPQQGWSQSAPAAQYAPPQRNVFQQDGAHYPAPRSGPAYEDAQVLANSLSVQAGAPPPPASGTVPPPPSSQVLATPPPKGVVVVPRGANPLHSLQLGQAAPGSEVPPFASATHPPGPSSAGPTATASASVVVSPAGYVGIGAAVGATGANGVPGALGTAPVVPSGPGFTEPPRRSRAGRPRLPAGTPRRPSNALPWQTFTCPFPTCGRLFTRKANLVTHQRIHLPATDAAALPYGCKECGRKFRWRSSAKSHASSCTHVMLEAARRKNSAADGLLSIALDGKGNPAVGGAASSTPGGGHLPVPAPAPAAGSGQAPVVAPAPGVAEAASPKK